TAAARAAVAAPPLPIPQPVPQALPVQSVQPAQTRIPQQVLINGQMARGVYVTTAGGQIESFTCSSPQHYMTPNNASQGWACYDQGTGEWLLNAVPPAQVQAAPAPVPVPIPQQTAVVVQQAPPVVVYQQPAPTIVYTAPAYPYVVAPAYPARWP